MLPKFYLLIVTVQVKKEAKQISTLKNVRLNIHNKRKLD